VFTWGGAFFQIDAIYLLHNRSLYEIRSRLHFYLLTQGASLFSISLLTLLLLLRPCASNGGVQRVGPCNRC